MHSAKAENDSLRNLHKFKDIFANLREVHHRRLCFFQRLSKIFDLRQQQMPHAAYTMTVIVYVESAALLHKDQATAWTHINNK